MRRETGESDRVMFPIPQPGRAGAGGGGGDGRRRRMRAVERRSQMADEETGTGRQLDSGVGPRTAQTGLGFR